MEGIKIFQTIIKTRLEIRKKIKLEIKWLISICQDISNRLEKSLNSNIISKIIYLDSTTNLNNYIKIINSIPFIIPLYRLNKRGSYSYAIKISKLKFGIISIIQEIGCCSINNIVKLFLNIKFNEFNYSNEKLELLDILNDYINPITCEIYTLQSDNSYSLDITSNINSNISPNINNKEQTTKLKLFDYQLNELSILKLIPFTKGLTLQLNGCKIFLPYKHTLLVINSYFYKITQYSYKYYKLTNDNYQKINNCFDSFNLDVSFKAGFLNQLSIRDILLNSAQELCDICQKKYNNLKKIRTKCLSNLIKEFINMEINEQYDIISTLLMNNNNENIYICFVLFDLFNQEKNNNGIKISDEIYRALSLEQQLILNKAKSKADMLSGDLLKYTEEAIPYEKRILLMKCDKSIKAKALEKLKEITSSKGGESSSKAQQYIEGLLKIPFGIYNYEPIISYLNEYKLLFNKYVNKLAFILNINVENIDISGKIEPINKADNHLSTNTINLILIKLNKKLAEVEGSILEDLFKKMTCKLLRKLLDEININKNGVKNLLVSKLIKNFDKIPLATRINLKLLDPLLLENTNLLNDFNGIDKKWATYKNNRKIYLENVNNILNTAVYGMDEAKQEIKRIIAQWINGSTDGYILGFEGPPGTGKTTLAKTGIAKCLKDENGDDRPFAFIALGGSTNGSTLEGHNYTYVGSTWGRIVESLIETQCMNPIIYIDELDKISRTEHGKELIGILIHLTDSSQNQEFMDKYFSGIKIDISKCLIIFSYNDVTKIDRVLLDRIHRIKIDALTRYDKYIITRDHLIPDICNKVGFNISDIQIDQETIFYIIDNYTLEAGVRKLKEKLFDIIREINLKYLQDDIKIFPQVITKERINTIFYNKSKIQVKKIPKTPSIGLVNGLYATSAGTGGITTIEAFKYLSDSRLNLELTGQQGDVMKESMRVSKTITWNLLPNNIKNSIRHDKPYGLHIHCPEAAQPKDGPSAGTAITIAMVSLLSKIPVNNEIAVTGEIDLNGNVLAIGGLEYKIEGAKSAGVKLVLCPEENRDDVKKILEGKHNPTKDCDFKIKTISNIYEAIDHMLMGDSKCSSLFQQYSKYSLSHNDYLLSFKSLCDSSSDLICILDTSPDFLLLYASKSFNNKLGWNLNELYMKSFINMIDKTDHHNFEKILLNTIDNETEQCIRFRILTKLETGLVVIGNTQKIDNIISCTMRLVEK